MPIIGGMPHLPLLPRLALALAIALAAPLAAFADPVPLDEPGFTDTITEQLRTALPDEHVVVVAPQRLTIGNVGFTVNLARLATQCRTTPARCDAEAAQFVAGTIEAFKTLNKPPDRSQVQIAVRSARTAQAYLASSHASGLNLQVQPFVGGLVSAVVIDSPRTVRWASSKDLEALQLDAAALRELARANTHAALQPLASVAQPATPGKLGAIEGDAYAASRLLFAADWAPMAKAQGGVLIVAAPRPGVLLYVGSDDATALGALRTLAHQQMAGARDALSDELLRWTPEGWKPVP